MLLVTSISPSLSLDSLDLDCQIRKAFQDGNMRHSSKEECSVCC
jgi:hypothetical protein